MSGIDPEADERERIRQRKAERLRNRLEGDDGGDAIGPDAGSQSNPPEPVHVTGPRHLEELVDDGGVVLVDFHADWCGPCKMLEPVLERIAAETDATVAKVDVDSQGTLASQYRVQSVPTLHLFTDGGRVEQLVGERDGATLRSLIERYA